MPKAVKTNHVLVVGILHALRTSRLLLSASIEVHQVLETSGGRQLVVANNQVDVFGSWVRHNHFPVWLAQCLLSIMWGLLLGWCILDFTAYIFDSMVCNCFLLGINERFIVGK